MSDMQKLVDWFDIEIKDKSPRSIVLKEVKDKIALMERSEAVNVYKNTAYEKELLDWAKRNL